MTKSGFLVTLVGLYGAGCTETETEHSRASLGQIGESAMTDMAAVAAVEAPAAEHCIQSEMNAIDDEFERFEFAFECGDELFETQFNALDGVGANVGDNQRFTRVPRADKRGPGEWARHTPKRATGPNGEACNHCHNAPADDGAGFAAVNVIRDPTHSGKLGRFINRQTPHLFGLGALQRLAEEMTEELQSQREAARVTACESRRRVRLDLSAKGVEFGRMAVACQSSRDKTRRVRGVDEDLVVRPLQWKGNTGSVREFNRDASNNELGMQSVEITGDDIDGDGDGVSNEFGVGDQSALAIYLAAQPRPVTRLELADLGLVELVDGERTAIERGEEVFVIAQCASCHTPALRIANPIFSEPSQHLAYRDETFPAGQDPIARGVDPDAPIVFDLTRDQPDNILEVGGVEVRLGAFEADENGAAVVRLYGDLKRHYMGHRLAENIDETGTGRASWITKELWGVGSTPPYLHNGSATTLTEAILAHGGEGRESRRAFSNLSEADQVALVVFLRNLVLFKAP